jgi:glyoxylase-like metal-dependent hydrolase (beta-lactamase superfamily II)
MILDLPGTEGITMVRCMGTNCYIIQIRDGLIVVDAGWRSGVNPILVAIKDNGFQPTDVALIILTHAHFDHFNFALELHERTGARIAAHRADMPYIERGGAGIFPHHIRAIFLKNERLVAKLFHAPAVVVDCVLEDGDVLEDWRVCHTPGHTPGTISLYSENRKVLITGGWAIPRKTLTTRPPWKNILVGYISTDPERLCESRNFLAGLDFQTLLCSHFRLQLFPLFARRLKSLKG